MAFLNVEDLVGNIEVIVFPASYEKYGQLISEDSKIFVKGRAALEEERDGKVICDQILTFEEAAQGKGFDQGRPGFQVRRMDSAPKPTPRPATSAKGLPEGIWIQFADAEDYERKKNQLQSMIADSDGNDDVVIYLKKEKNFKILPMNMRVSADEELLQRLIGFFGQENVKIRRKAIENK